MEKIKKVVLREDLLAITGDFRKAIILNQFIYWSERVSDADKFIENEKMEKKKRNYFMAGYTKQQKNYPMKSCLACL
jgi:hypothetical protein